MCHPSYLGRRDCATGHGCRLSFHTNSVFRSTEHLQVAYGSDRATSAQLSRKQVLDELNRAWSCNEFQPAWPQIFVHTPLGHGENDDYSLILQGAEHSSPHPTTHLARTDLLRG